MGDAVHVIVKLPWKRPAAPTFSDGWTPEKDQILWEFVSRYPIGMAPMAADWEATASRLETSVSACTQRAALLHQRQMQVYSSNTTRRPSNPEPPATARRDSLPSKLPVAAEVYKLAVAMDFDWLRVVAALRAQSFNVTVNDARRLYQSHEKTVETSAHATTSTSTNPGPEVTRMTSSVIRIDHNRDMASAVLARETAERDFDFDDGNVASNIHSILSGQRVATATGTSGNPTGATPPSAANTSGIITPPVARPPMTVAVPPREPVVMRPIGGEATPEEPFAPLVRPDGILASPPATPSTVTPDGSGTFSVRAGEGDRPSGSDLEGSVSDGLTQTDLINAFPLSPTSGTPDKRKFESPIGDKPFAPRT